MNQAAAGDAGNESSRSALANVLGALALVITNELEQTVLQASARSTLSDASALSALSEFLEGASLDRLHQVLGVTPSGTVRLVDRLSEASLVTRAHGSDGRSRALHLTDSGRSRAETIRHARLTYLLALTDTLSDEEVSHLRDLLGQVMAGVVGLKSGGAWICRLCDLAACRRSLGECPTYNAASSKTPPAVP